MNEKVALPYWVTLVPAFLFGFIGGIANPLTWIAFTIWSCFYLLTHEDITKIN